MDALRLPLPSTSSLVMLAIVLAGMFFLAVGLEIRRRRNIERRRLAASWKHVETVLHEKQISSEETRLVRELIEQHMPRDPAGAVTSRRAFNLCVRSHMEQCKKEGDKAAFNHTGEMLRDLRIRLSLDFVPVGQPIESTLDLHAGQSLLASWQQGAQGHWFRVHLADNNEAHMTFTADIPPGERLPAPGESVRLQMWREDDARYQFSATVSDTSPDLAQFRTWHPGELRRLQSRAYFRVRQNRPATFGVVNAPLDGNYEGLIERPVVTRIRGRITSLSAGGYAAELPQSVPLQMLLRTVLDFPDEEPVALFARIVGMSGIGGGHYLARCSYVGIDDDTREAVARYVWQKQQPVELREHAAE
jgi:c-di-GMP-binding flagellar brake protein YcgR